MPASSKSQQRFGVVKAMQKGDIPKKGKAGKIAKQMSKKDVDDFASTKHKGKPEKVKREMKVRNLIKKMVREELAKMNEEKLSEDFKNNEWEVYVADEKGKEKIVKVAKSKRAGVILYNKLINTDKFHEVGMRVIKEGKLSEGISVADTRFVGKFVIHILSSGSEMRSAILSKKNNSKYGTKDKKDLKTLWDLAGKYKGKEIKEGKLTESQQVAKTILQQLGGNKFIAMTGAKNFGSSKNSLQFKIGRNSKSISHVIITLKSSDLYDVEFIRMRGTSRKVVKKLKGVYADMLQKIFTKYTGMNTRL